MSGGSTRYLPRAFVRCAAACVIAGCGAAGQSHGERYAGDTNRNGAVSFTVRAGEAVGFRFVNLCPSDSAAGTAVPTMTIRRGTFTYTDGQFMVSGHLDGSKANGTASDVTGDCDSGTLSWRAARVS